MQQLTPYLMCSDTGAAIDWYVEVFQAQETRPRLVTPDGEVMNAEIRIGDAVVMLADHRPDVGSTAPDALSATTVVLDLHVENVDEVFERALKAGAEEVFPVADQFYGDRAGRLRDPFGHAWILKTSIEEVSGEEMKARFDAMFE